jgi:pilus assembly protein CpaB
MKPARILVLAVALVAGLAAALLASNSKPPEVVVQAPPPPAPTDAVLVAKKDLHPDDHLDETSMEWKPMDNIPEGLIRKSAEPNAIDEKKGWTVIESMDKDDYLRPRRISKDPRSGLLASLHAGMRAVSINIDAQGSSTAGGFILPNHYVDVIHIFRDDHFIRMFQSEQYSERVDGNPWVSQIILENVRVLAIGQKEQALDSDHHVITGPNATLEVTPEQAETLLITQRTGSLALILRKLNDENAGSEDKKRLAGDLKIGWGRGAAQDKMN